MLLTVLRRESRCCSYSVLFCGLYYGALHVLKSSRALCPRVSSFLLALWSPRLGKRELVCVLLVHLFVCFVRVSFCHFFSSSWCRGWLRFVIVTLPGLSRLIVMKGLIPIDRIKSKMVPHYIPSHVEGAVKPDVYLQDSHKLLTKIVMSWICRSQWKIVCLLEEEKKRDLEVSSFFAKDRRQWKCSSQLVKKKWIETKQSWHKTNKY